MKLLNEAIEKECSMSDTIKYRGYEIEISDSDPAENPRDWCNLGTLALKGCGWAEESIDDQEDLYTKLLEEEEFRPYSKAHVGYDYYEIDAEKAQRNIESKYIVLPVYKYEHGNVCYSTSIFSCAWDSGQNGFIYVSKDDVRKEYSVKRITAKLRAQVLACLANEVKIFSQAASGEVFGWLVEDVDEDHIGMCGGYYGYDHEESGLLDDARSSIDCHIASLRKANIQRLKDMIRNRVPLFSRVGELYTIT